MIVATMSAAQNNTLEPFRLRGANFNLLVLRLLDPRVEAVVPAIADQFRRAPGVLRHAPVVLGLADIALAPQQVDFAGLVAGLRAAEIVPIGTTGGSAEMRAAAQAVGLPPLRGSGDSEPPAVASPGAAPVVVAPVAAPPPRLPVGMQRPTMLVELPVRSGQRIWAEGADLIVTATVNAGAEVIADGNVHVYGALKGRAIAGASDNPLARVFALQFDPELVSIAGYYAARENLVDSPLGRAVQVRLNGETMQFDRL